MLSSVCRTLRRGLVGLVLLDLATAAAAWPQPPVPPRRAMEHAFRVLVPAHNEAHVLPNLVRDLLNQNYPPHLVDIVVVADRCSDGTAAVARRCGVRVQERMIGSGSKGAALAWSLQREPLGWEQALLVLDADNRIEPDLLRALADELADGAEVLQCRLDVLGPEETWLTRASALAYWSGNRLTQVARRNLGLSADLGGTGMCLSSRALLDSGFADGSSEDRDLAVRLLLRGKKVRWVHHARVLDEKPAQIAVAVRQRARWGRGLDEVRRRHLAALAVKAVHDRDPAAADFALRLLRPSRSALLLFTCIAALVETASETGRPRRGTFLLLAVQTASPAALLLRDGVPLRWVAQYPLALALPVLSAAGRLTRSRQQEWYHTPHRGGPDG